MSKASEFRAAMESCPRFEPGEQAFDSFSAIVDGDESLYVGHGRRLEAKHALAFADWIRDTFGEPAAEETQ